MRVAGAALLIGSLVGCMDNPAGPPAEATQIQYDQAIRKGDLVLLVPGTGSLDYLGAPIEALAGSDTDPIVDVRQVEKVAGDSVVFEQAIAMAHRAGLSNDDLNSGALTFAMWGAGFQKLTQFEYVSYEGIQLHVLVLGGQNTCATGSIFSNLLNYSTTNADIDARDLYSRTRAWLNSNASTGEARHVIVASHSWGGAVAEWLQFNLPQYESAIGPLNDGADKAPMVLTIADGVPFMILNHPMMGPGLQTMTEGLMLEIDRPDDPVHKLSTSGNGGGHMYTIMFGSDFQGSYGITTNEMSCDGVPGECGSDAGSGS
jgi:hypothetical protein|nr:hypothetical protein [Kofleriaceae bacterium]